MWKVLYTSLSCFFALLQVLVMCCDHLRSLLMVTLKYFTDDQGVIGWPSIFGLILWLWGSRSVFLWLGVRPWDFIYVIGSDLYRFASHQSLSWSRFGLYKRISSAYNIRLELTERDRLVIEFITMLKSIGPSIEPRKSQRSCLMNILQGLLTAVSHWDSFWSISAWDLWCRCSGLYGASVSER